jgi:hypothetical protein
MLSDFRKRIIFGSFPGFALLFFWKEQNVDEDEYGALVELY